MKTTRFARELPFHVTRTEVDFSAETGQAYRLARVYQLGSQVKGRTVAQYRLSGPLRDSLWLNPQDYLAGPR